MRYRLDNELQLIYVCVFQTVIQVPYLDRLLYAMQATFKMLYVEALHEKNYYAHDYEFDNEFRAALSLAETWAKSQSKTTKHMRSFDESAKSKKTVASMITSNDSSKPATKKVNIVEDNASAFDKTSSNKEQLILENRKKLKDKLSGKKSPPESKANKDIEKNKKKPRVWELGGSSKDVGMLDRSKDQPEDTGKFESMQESVSFVFL